MSRGVLVLGSGKRVVEAGLPALLRTNGDFEVRSIFAKREKDVTAGGEDFHVRAFESFAAADLDGVDLIYLAVTKNAVPAVLERLARERVDAIDLLIDTPVVRFKHFRAVRHVDRFRAAWVAEDTSTLPWIPALRQAQEELDLGALRRVVFDRSAYAYHGVATAKTLLECPRVLRGRVRAGIIGANGAKSMRQLGFANGTQALVYEPRDYSVGHVVLEYERGSVSDRPWAGDHLLAPIPVSAESGAWRGFDVAGITTWLDDDQIALLGDDGDAEATPTARMDDLKRVGFLGLLRGILEGRGAYPLEEAIDDMIVDYHLEKLGRFLANPVTTARSPIGRFLLSTLSRAAGP